MTERPSISIDDLTPEQRKQLKLRKPRRHEFTKNDVRTAALRVLAVVADLTPSQRARVLAHAEKVNDL